MALRRFVSLQAARQLRILSCCLSSYNLPGRHFSESPVLLTNGENNTASDEIRSMEGELRKVHKESDLLVQNDDAEISSLHNGDREDDLVEPTIADLDRSIPQVDCEFIASLVRCRNHRRLQFLEEKALLKQRVAQMTEKAASSVMETSRFKRLGSFELWRRTSTQGNGEEDSDGSSESAVVVAPSVLEQLTINEKDILNSARPEYNDGFILLDCRTVNEVTSWGLIEGAKVLPAHEIFAAFHATPEEFEIAYGFPKPHPEDRIICYCQYGPRSLMAAQMLSWMGYLKVLHFRDGYYEWGKQYNLLLRRWMEHDRTSGNELRRMAAFRAALEMQREIAPEFNKLPMQEASNYRLDVSRSPGTLRIGDGLRAEAYAAVAALAESLPLLEEGEGRSSPQGGGENLLPGEQHLTKFLEQATGIDPATEGTAGTFALSDAQEASLQHTTKEHVDPFSSKR